MCYQAGRGKYGALELEWLSLIQKPENLSFRGGLLWGLQHSVGKIQHHLPYFFYKQSI
jgi:hypothetical protein